MLNKKALYTISLLALLNFISSCTNAIPAQDISEARQALESAKVIVKTDDDKKDFREASMLLNKAEEAVAKRRYDLAKPLVKQSKIQSQKILQRYHSDENQRTNVKFEY